MVISLDSTTGAPVNSGLLVLTFNEIEGGTTAHIHYDYEPKAALGMLFGPILDRVLSKGLRGFLDDLETEATRQATS